MRILLAELTSWVPHCGKVCFVLGGRRTGWVLAVTKTKIFQGFIHDRVPYLVLGFSVLFFHSTSSHCWILLGIYVLPLWLYFSFQDDKLYTDWDLPTPVHILVVLSSFQGRLSESYLLNGWKKTQIPFSICTTQLKVWRRTSLPCYLSVPWFSLWDLYYGIRFKARSWERVWWPLRQLFTIAMASPGWLHTSKSLPGPSRIFQFSLEALGRHWQASTWPTLV